MEMTHRKSQMRKIILDSPKQFKVGLEAAKDIKVRGKFDAVVICGMGGSALAGDILKIWLDAYKIALPVYIHHNYEIPEELDERHLVICMSYSGNTEETLSSFEKAREKALPLMVITSGGKLAARARSASIPMTKIPSGYPPRMTLGYQFAALMRILENSGVIRNNLENLSSLGRTLKPTISEPKGKRIAKRLMGKIPLIFASERFLGLARIWKIKFNENAKIPAFSDVFPELNHNEMVSFTPFPASQKPGQERHVLVLRDKADDPRVLKRMKLTVDLIKNSGFTSDTIAIEGKDILSKVFSAILLGDWVSYYTALGYGVDPIPVKLVEEFKKIMAK